MGTNYPTPVLVRSEQTAFFMQQQVARRFAQAGRISELDNFAEFSEDQTAQERKAGENLSGGMAAQERKAGENLSGGMAAQERKAGENLSGGMAAQERKAGENLSDHESTHAGDVTGETTRDPAASEQVLWQTAVPTERVRPVETSIVPQQSAKQTVLDAPNEKPQPEKYTPPKQLQQESAKRFQEFRSRKTDDTQWLPEVSLFDTDEADVEDYYVPVVCDIDRPVARHCFRANDFEVLDHGAQSA
jgi:hypothetical protein